ncbi:alanine--tRNA ligase-related protein, partial [Streptococcus suis]
DHEGFEKAMKEQQERARASVVKGGSMGMQNETLSGITEPSNFDYERQELDATLSVIVADNERTEMVSEGEALLVFDQTPFYAE